MILTCASCSTRYYTDDAAIGPNGRTVRCAACSHEWFAEPQLVLQHDSHPPKPPKPEPLTREKVERMRRAADQPGPAQSAAALYRQQQHERMRKERARVAVAAWTGTGIALAASVGGAVVFRQDVAEIWPRSASAFAAVGLDVNVYGLEFYDLSVERAFEGATPVLLVSGEVRNIGRGAKAPPPVRVTLRDAHSRELYEVVHALGGQEIHGGGATPFQIRIENPPADAVDLETTFAAYGARPTETASAAPAVSSFEPPLVLAPGQQVEESSSVSSVEGRSPVDGLAPRFAPESEGRG